MKYKVGDIVHSFALGRKGNYKCVLKKCPTCGEEKFVYLFRKTDRCLKCSGIARRGKRPNNFKGGKNYTKEGYARVLISGDDPFFEMSQPMSRGKNGTILEHRLIMARKLGRPLTQNEIVHHKNGIKDDNRIENLEVMLRTDHCKHTGYCAGYENGQRDLAKKIYSEICFV